MSGIRLTDVQLSLLADAYTEGTVHAVTEFEAEQILVLIDVGYLDDRHQLTHLGRGAYLGQRGNR